MKKTRPAPLPSRAAKGRIARVFKALGGPVATAELLGVSRQAVAKWLDVPGHAALELEAATKGELSAHYLAPAIYPKWLKTWPRP